jgi:hypothetical protein
MLCSTVDLAQSICSSFSFGCSFVRSFDEHRTRLSFDMFIRCLTEIERDCRCAVENQFRLNLDSSHLWRHTMQLVELIAVRRTRQTPVDYSIRRRRALDRLYDTMISPFCSSSSPCFHRHIITHQYSRPDTNWFRETCCRSMHDIFKVTML